VSPELPADWLVRPGDLRTRGPPTPTGGRLLPLPEMNAYVGLIGMGPARPLGGAALPRPMVRLLGWRRRMPWRSLVRLLVYSRFFLFDYMHVSFPCLAEAFTGKWGSPVEV